MSKSALKLLERMRRSPSGWKPGHLHRLYLGFGFKHREGAKHTVYWHPQYPGDFTMRDTVPRHGELPLGYVPDAVKRVDEVLRRDADNTETGGKAP